MEMCTKCCVQLTDIVLRKMSISNFLCLECVCQLMQLPIDAVCEVGRWNVKVMRRGNNDSSNALSPKN